MKNKSQVTEEGRSGSVADWSCLLWLLTVLVWRGNWRWLKNYSGRRSAVAKRSLHLCCKEKLRDATGVWRRRWLDVAVAGAFWKESWFLSWGWRRRSVAAVGVSIERRLGHEVEELVMGEEEVEEETLGNWKNGAEADFIDNFLSSKNKMNFIVFFENFIVFFNLISYNFLIFYNKASIRY